MWKHLDAFPPILVRLAARGAGRGQSVKALSNAEIAIVSDIPLWRILEITRLFVWDDVTISEARRFCAACRFDPTVTAHRSTQYRYQKICRTQQKHPKPPPYLTESPQWTTEFLPLIEHLKSWEKSRTA